MLVHTGEMPHKCHLCSMTFRLQISLNRHVHKIHEKITEPVEEEHIADKNPIIYNSVSGGQTRVESVYCCPFHLCSFTITKVRRIPVLRITPAPNSCFKLLLLHPNSSPALNSFSCCKLVLLLQTPSLASNKLSYSISCSKLLF